MMILVFVGGIVLDKVLEVVVVMFVEVGDCEDVDWVLVIMIDESFGFDEDVVVGVIKFFEQMVVKIIFVVVGDDVMFKEFVIVIFKGNIIIIKKDKDLE